MEYSTETGTIPTTDSSTKYFFLKLIPHLMCITRVLVYRSSHSSDHLAILWSCVYRFLSPVDVEGIS